MSDQQAREAARQKAFETTGALDAVSTYTFGEMMFTAGRDYERTHHTHDGCVSQETLMATEVERDEWQQRAERTRPVSEFPCPNPPGTCARCDSVSDAEVEAAAKVLQDECWATSNTNHWGQITESERQVRRNQAHAALTAAYLTRKKV